MNVFENLDVSTGIVDVSGVDYTVDYGVLLNRIYNICDRATVNYIRLDFKDEDDVRLKYDPLAHKLDLRTLGKNLFDPVPFIDLFVEYPFIKLRLSECRFDVGMGVNILPVLKQCEFWRNRRYMQDSAFVLKGMERKGVVDIAFEYNNDYFGQIYHLQEYFRTHEDRFWEVNCGFNRLIFEGKYCADFKVEKLK